MQLVTSADLTSDGPSAWEATCTKVGKLAQMEAVTRPKFREVLMRQDDEEAHYDEVCTKFVC